jgi:glycosyltransferase involved in cell wall biosynthesis
MLGVLSNPSVRMEMTEEGLKQAQNFHGTNAQGNSLHFADGLQPPLADQASDLANVNEKEADLSDDIDRIVGRCSIRTAAGTRKLDIVSLRVCVLTETFYPPTIGGQQKNLHELATSLIAKGMEVTVVTRQPMPAAKSREILDGISVIRVAPGGEFKGQGWRALVPLTSFLFRVFRVLVHERKNFDVMLVSGLKILPPVAVAVSLLFDKGCIIRAESSIEFGEPISNLSRQRMRLGNHSLVLRIMKTLQYAIAKRADCIVAISSEIGDVLRAEGFDDERIEHVPNGINLTRFCPAAQEEKLALRQKLCLPSNNNVFIYTGRLVTSKGIPELIRAWQRVTLKYPNAYLVLVGSGTGCFDDYESQLRQAVAESDLQRWVAMPGAVSNVEDYLRASDVFVFPSHYEGFGISLIEAMACGMPSIATGVGVAAECMQNEKTGLLIAPRNDSELESALKWMLEHQCQWSSMGDLARSVVLGKYSMQLSANLHLNLLLSVLERRKQRPG